MLELLLKYNKYACTVFYILFSTSSYAGLLLSQSRVVMNITQPELVMYVVNTNEYPVLMQTWVTDENSDALPNQTQSPFVVLPPLAKLQPGEKKRLTVYYSGEKLVNQPEKLYLLNLHEVPPAPENTENKIIVSMTTQFKLFLRSEELRNIVREPVEYIQCHKESNGKIRITNDSPFYFNYVNINEENYSGYLLPYENRHFSLNKIENIEVLYIDDYGQTKILTLPCIS